MPETAALQRGDREMRRSKFAIALLIGMSVAASPGLSQETAPAPTTPSVAEITALLDQEKPDPEKRAKLVAAADAPIPANLTGAKRGEALFHRAEARRLIGRIGEAIADAQEALKLSKGENYERVTSRYEQFVQRRLRETGDDRHALPILMAHIRVFQAYSRGRLFTNYTELAHLYGTAGNIAQVEQIDRTLHALLAESRSWGAAADPFRTQFQANTDDIDGYLLELKNRYADAEALYRRSRVGMQTLVDRYDDAIRVEGVNLLREDIERSVDNYQLLQARMKIEQGRAVEGEVDIREVLLRRLQRLGKYHEETAAAVYGL